MDALAVGVAAGVGLVLVVAAVARVPSPSLRVPLWYVRWSDQVTRSGIQGLTPLRLVFVSAGVSVLVGMSVFVWTRVEVVSGVLLLAAFPLPFAVVGMRARRRSKELRAVWPEVVDSLVSGVRAGASLADVLMDLEDSAPEQLRPYFRLFAREYRASGRFEFALDVLKRSMADPVADRIVEALRIAREVGGADLSRILRDLAGMLRDDARIRGELEARQSWTVNAARLGIAAPWLVLVMISGQEHAARAYSTSGGLIVLAVGAAASVVAYVLMQRIGRLSVADRSLR